MRNSANIAAATGDTEDHQIPRAPNDGGSLQEAFERTLTAEEKNEYALLVKGTHPEQPLTGLYRKVRIAYSNEDIPRSRSYKHTRISLACFLRDNLLVGEGGPKEGRHYLQGGLKEDGPRKGVETLDMMVFDVDNGQPSAEVKAVATERAISVIIHPTANNLKAMTSVSSDVIHKYYDLGPDDELTGEQVIEYLKGSRNWRPEIAATFSYAGYKDHAYHVKHEPYERFRVVVPFAETVRFVELSKTKDGSRNVWKATYRSTSKWLGIEEHDASCEDLERAIYTFRGPELEGVEAWIYNGDLVTFDFLRKLPAVDVSGASANATTKTKAPRRSTGKGQTRESITCERNGARGEDQLSRAVRKRLASESTRKNFAFGRFCLEHSAGFVAKSDNDGSTKVSGPCPFGHTDASGDEFMAKDADEAHQTDGHPVAKCHHPDCEGKSVADFTAQILRLADESVEALDEFIDDTGDRSEDLDAAVERLNQRYAVTRLGGNVLIAVAPQSTDEAWAFMKTEHLRLLHKPERVNVPTNNGARSVEAFTEWEKHPNRRTYNAVVFNPRGVNEADDTPEDVLNMWHGFSVLPVEGDWSLIRKHLFDNICQGDPYLFAWVICWLADLVQYPAKKKGTSIVVRGKKGTGKSIVAKCVRALFARNSLSLSKREHLLGRFNGHLAQVVFTVCEETFWAGDKSGEGVIKDLITGETIAIEAKGKDLFEVNNHVHLWQCSNEDWVVPATVDERRFLVLDVSDAHREDFQYFAAIDAQMKDGGLAAMLFDLARIEIPNWIELRSPPLTAALLEQIEHGLKTHQMWLRQCLHAGDFIDPLNWAAFRVKGASDWRLPTDAVYKSYCQYAEQQKEKYPAKRGTIGRLLHDIGVTRVRVGSNNEGYYVFPPISEMRAKALSENLIDATEELTSDRGVAAEKLRLWTEYGSGGKRPGGDGGS